MINLNSTFPSNSGSPTADYPYGSARNVTTTGDNTGTPFVASLQNDIIGNQQYLLQEATVVPNNTPDNATTSQQFEAMWKIFNTRTFTKNMTLNADYTLTSRENLRTRIVITDTTPVLTTGRNIIVDLVPRFITAINNTAQILTFKTPAGTGIAVPAGTGRNLYCDGTNIINNTVGSDLYVALTGNQTISGTKTFNGASKTLIGDNALEVITSGSNGASGSFMISQGAKYGLGLNGSGTTQETGNFTFKVVDRDSNTVKNASFNIGVDGVVSYSFFPVTPSLAPTTNYQVANKKYVDDKLVDSTETVAGIIELATTAEAQGGTDNLRAITPLKLRNALNATGTAPIYACRAWVKFNGTGTVTINASGNVSSITDNGTGDYTVNFTVAMPDANYNICGIGRSTILNNLCLAQNKTTTETASSVRVATTEASSTISVDVISASISIFR